MPYGASSGYVVVTASGVNSNSVSFAVTPTIADIVPPSGLPSESITISGSNFGATQGGSSVTFYSGVAATPTAWSDTEITVPVPSGASTGNVTVTVSSYSSNGVSFAICAICINGISPTRGPVGTSVTISGSGFGSTQGSSTIQFSGTAATVTGWSGSGISVAVPGVVMPLGDSEQQ